MGAFLAAIVTLGTGVIVASIIYQLVTNPAGTNVLVSGVQNVTNSTVTTLFK